jgi:hypothetical protein
MDINLEKDIDYKLRKLEDIRQKVDKMPTGYLKDKALMEICEGENRFMDWISQKMIGSKKRYE